MWEFKGILFVEEVAEGCRSCNVWVKYGVDGIGQ